MLLLWVIVILVGLKNWIIFCVLLYKLLVLFFFSIIFMWFDGFILIIKCEIRLVVYMLLCWLMCKLCGFLKMFWFKEWRYCLFLLNFMSWWFFLLKVKMCFFELMVMLVGWIRLLLVGVWRKLGMVFRINLGEVVCVVSVWLIRSINVRRSVFFISFYVLLDVI